MKLEELKKYSHAEICRDVNYFNIPKTLITASEQGAEEFNSIYRCCVLDNPQPLRKIQRTPSGGIKTGNSIRFQYDIIIKGISIELTYIGPEGMFRFIFNGRPEGKSGSECFSAFLKKCKEHNIELSDYAIMNGKDVKRNIEAPHIQLFCREGKVYKDAHHLDINSSFMAGIAFAYPELREVIEDIYSNRKTDPECKDILTHTYGYFQSEYCKVRIDDVKYPYAFAHLSQSALAFNNRMIEDIIIKLIESGRRVLATNTDGIWYSGKVYHDSNEGTALGQWKTDMTDCTIRFKSKGCYEYIDGDNNYKAVVRGRTRLDKVKSRDSWCWGDIYNDNCKNICFTFTDDKGIICKNVETEEEEF